jgi:tetratricopeptide (TPR) repeat protein/predicted Ser/Thr protein kinase
MPDPAAVQRLFTAACDLSPADRAAFLAAQCRDDEALRAEVEALLRADAEASLFGEPGLGALRLRLDSGAEPLPERIGPFRVLGELGRGGMGVVYRAQQDQPSREVALKVLGAAGGAAAARARFALEVEALGRLQHPGIASILQAGTFRSAHGEQPYLAMELVHGEPLHAWVRRTRPDLPTRLAVLLEVCDAVHHAHQKGLIHRDLKPGNVFVDRSNHAKVLDFGIARLVDADEDRALRTRTGQLLGTLAYMSPEQASGAPDAVDVRSDVYSLGVLGYELLGERLPLEFGAAPLTESLRRLVDEVPPPLDRLDRRLGGDLATIFATALRKEPERRYASVQALAADLRRHLAHEPIEARPATAAYVIGRFARRHRGLVAGTGLAVVALLAGSGLAVRWALRADAAAVQATAAEELARREEAQAKANAERATRAEATARQEATLTNRVLGFVEELFSAAAPAMALGREITAKEIVEKGLKAVDEGLADEPLLRARLSQFLAQTLGEMGDTRRALPLLAESLATLRRELPADDLRIEQALLNQARGLYEARDLEAAQPLFAEALALHEAAGRPRDGWFARAHEGLGACAFDRGDTGAALRHYTIVQEVRATDPDPDVRAGDCVRLANAHGARGETEQAEQWFAKAHALLQQGDDQLLRATVATNLGALRASQERYAEAEPLFREALASGEAVLGKDHPLLIRRLCNVAAVLSATGRYEEAGPLLERALELGAKGGARFDDGIANSALNLGNVRGAQGRHQEALALYERAAAIYRRLQGPRSPSYADALENMAIAHERLGATEPAAELRRQVEAIRRR